MSFDEQPHQNYKYIQLTSNTDCNGNVGCEIARTEVEGTSANQEFLSTHNGIQALTLLNQARASAGPPA